MRSRLFGFRVLGRDRREGAIPFCMPLEKSRHLAGLELVPPILSQVTEATLDMEAVRRIRQPWLAFAERPAFLRFTVPTTTVATACMRKTASNWEARQVPLRGALWSPRAVPSVWEGAALWWSKLVPKCFEGGIGCARIVRYGQSRIALDGNSCSRRATSRSDPGQHCTLDYGWLCAASCSLGGVWKSDGYPQWDRSSFLGIRYRFDCSAACSAHRPCL